MIQFLNAMWFTMTALAPSLIFGLLVAGVLHVFVKRDRILKHLGKPGFGSSARAALVGVPLPLCSCGVLPAALSLKRDGASDGAVTSFLISTPQTGVDSIAVTWGILGLPIALAKVAAAFIAGLIGGIAADWSGGGRGKVERVPPSCATNETGSIPARIWRYATGTIFRDIHRWLLLGIVISALITVFLAPGQLSEYPILRGPLGLLAALALGIPLYVCSISSVPIAAGLIYAGFPVGSALVFLMAGPATNAATMGAVRKSLGRRVFIIYLSTVILVSIAAGLLLNSLNVSVTAPAEHMHHGGAGVFPTIAAVLLGAGILWYAAADISRTIQLRRSSRSSGKSLMLNIRGMSCSMCEEKVRKALNGVSGLQVVAVSAESDTAELKASGNIESLSEEACNAVRNAGYECGRGN